MIARLGGDEFGLIFEAAEASAIDAVCRKALASCAANFSVHGCEIDLTSSAGYVRSGDHRSRDAVDLVRYADIALYAAKHKGRNRACRFDTEMDESAKFRHLVESGLRQAIARDELSLLYQPIVDRNSLNIVGFEALLRWNSQEHGDISPQVFVPIAEEGPLIQEIGDWVMDKAIAESRNWQQHYVSINLSVRQLGRADLVERLCQLAARHGASHDNIQLEVTETALFENAELAATKLQTLRGLGFRIALDDFGTGYSTMFNIKNFAIDCIKIDKSFIDDLGNDNQSAAIVASGRKDGQITVRGETVSHGRGAVFTQRRQGQGRDRSGGDPRRKPSGARYFSGGLTVWATPFDNGKGRPIVLSTAQPAQGKFP